MLITHYSKMKSLRCSSCLSKLRTYQKTSCIN